MDARRFLESYEEASIAGTQTRVFPLLKPSIALRCILDGVVRGFRFEGVEGFILHPDGRIQPDQGISFDRVDYAEVSKFIAAVVDAILQNLGKENVAFEVVFDQIGSG